MRTRVAGSESPGTEDAPFQAGQCHKPTDATRHIAIEPLALGRVRQEFSSGIAEYCSHFQVLADAAPQMMWRFGPDGECKYVNTRWLEYRGSTAEQERGAGWMEGVHPEDINRCATAYRSAFETRQPFHLEFRVRRADASYGSVVAHAVPQYLLDGSFVGYVGSLEEASHQDSGSAQHEQSSVEASESARLALCQIAASLRSSSSSPVSERRRPTRRKQKKTLPVKVLLECLDISITPLLVVDQSGRAVYCNCAFQELAAKRLPTTRVETASNLAKWPRLTGKSSSRRDNSTPARNYAPEVQAWLDADSIEQDISVSAQALTVAADELTMFSIIDATQENRTSLLERAFLHDLVNATGSIQMLIDLLTGGTSRQERNEYVNLLQVSVNRLLSEIYHEKMMLDTSNCTPFKVREILTALAEYYRGHHFGRNCRIEIKDSAVESLALAGDQTLLVRVLDNMLRNAVEAPGHGGVVTLGCRQIGGELEFWVHNPNTISENVRAKIFHRSITIDGRARDQEIKLLGELCGGTVAVSSDQQSGTTYSVRYPAAVETVFPQRRYHTKHAV
jgi:PAS domain S-box-containing protein